MKVTPQDLERISEKVKPLDTEELRRRYLERNIPRGDAVVDINKRYRWDLFYYSAAYQVVEGDYKDAHIYTALCKIIPDIQEE